MSNKITTDLLEFIENSPSCFHAVQTTKEILTKHGFTELSEDQTWNLTPVMIILLQETDLLSLRSPFRNL